MLATLNLCSLTNVEFYGVELQGSEFCSCSLKIVSFEKSDISRVKFLQTDISECIFIDTNLDELEIPDGNIFLPTKHGLCHITANTIRVGIYFENTEAWPPKKAISDWWYELLALSKTLKKGI